MMYNKNIIAGFEDGTFRPDDAVTREQFVKLISAACNLKSSGNSEMNFSDVRPNDWYYECIAAAYENDVIKGVSSELFGVGEYISREDAATILNRVSKEKLNGDLPIKNAYKFSDFRAQFTEVAEMGRSGYAADLTDALKKYGFLDNINPAVLKCVSYDDKIIAVPNGAAIMGLSCNIDLFRQVGLLEADETPKTLTEFSRILCITYLRH